MEKEIRNFCIIAHIDHGKSTLADRLLEYTHTIPFRQLREQTLDTMDLERERGISIKAHAISLLYRPRESKEYILNLIDTPGHVDFSYEVSRSLNACEGTLLLIDAAQGVEAQTLANLYLARQRNLRIIPVINKVDLPVASPPRVMGQLEKLEGINSEEAILASAKDGRGVKEILEAIIKRIPPPPLLPQAPLKALIFDSFFDPHRGPVACIRIFEGKVGPGMNIKVMSSGREFKVEEVGIIKLKRVRTPELTSGEVGYIITNMKRPKDLKIGDTMTEARRPTASSCPGFREPKPMVLCGLYPADEEKFENLEEALSKLKLNDSSLSFRGESSPALGTGFRCGFLGLLHKEIVQERLEREFNLNLITTAPNVRYRVVMKTGETLEIESPAEFPSQEKIKTLEEPHIKATIITPQEYLGPIFKLLEKRRGKFLDMDWLDNTRVRLSHHIPLGEVAMGFHDQLKSVSQGYASFDYDHSGYQEADLIKLEILVNGKSLPSLSSVVHRETAYLKGKNLISRLKMVIPRQLFPIPLQAAVGRKIIARETIPALRKDVTAPLYGGDITRKRKLLDRQKKGKKRMRKFGEVSIPQEAFLIFLETG